MVGNSLGSGWISKRRGGGGGVECFDDEENYYADDDYHADDNYYADDNKPEVFSLSDHSLSIVPRQGHFWLV